MTTKIWCTVTSKQYPLYHLLVLVSIKMKIRNPETKSCLKNLKKKRNSDNFQNLVYWKLEIISPVPSHGLTVHKFQPDPMTIVGGARRK